jgi:hypothetical protein
MSLHHQLMTCCQDDARRAGERDRVLLETRRARGALRPRPDPVAAAWRLIWLPFRRMAAARRTFPVSAEQIAESSLHTSLSPRSTTAGHSRM